jgi:hypothetical protein
MKTDEIVPRLRAAFACVPDVRSRQRRRDPLAALLPLATAALRGIHGEELAGVRPRSARIAHRS